MKKRFLILLWIILLTMYSCRPLEKGGDNTEPTPAMKAENTIPIVKATGKVVPREYATLSMEMSGKIKEIHFEENDPVSEGQILIQLEGSIEFEAAITAAEQEVLIAQQALEELSENADFSYAVAFKELAEAKDRLDDAKRDWNVNQPGNRYTPQSLKDAKADVIITEERLKKARNKYNNASGRKAKAHAQSALTDARKAYYQAKWLLEWLQSDPTELELIQLEADLVYAETSVQKAEQELDRLKDGPDPDDVELARIRLRTAIAHQKAAQYAMNHLALEAPFDGTISQVFIHANEWISIGQPVLQIADLSHLHVETVDLNELDVARIGVGDPARVTFDAFPDIEVNGRVAEIAPKSEEGPGVNFPVMIELEEVPDLLRWGMTAFVTIDCSQ
jgi:multidrug resistance efflux pump